MEDIQSVSKDNKDYPAGLKKLSDAPKILYYRGVLPTEKEDCVAVVGTRRPSPYGQQAALQITGELANAGVTVVSGMAPGIDTFAHTTCVQKGKRTIAVLGTGLDEKSIYPQQNVGLSRQILHNGGCLISEFAPGTPGYPANFARRNRIISALSLGVLVVEAKEKSGSLITANYARSQHKKLFAVPGPIYSLNAQGPNKLIKEGATLVERGQDILDVLGIKAKTPVSEKSAAKTGNEALIFAALGEEPLGIDAIIEQTKLPAHVVASQLALMEISGTIRNLGSQTYAKA